MYPILCIWHFIRQSVIVSAFILAIVFEGFLVSAFLISLWSLTFKIIFQSPLMPGFYDVSIFRHLTLKFI